MNVGKIFSGLLSTVVLFAALGAVAPDAYGVEVVNNEDTKLSVGGVFQTYAFIEQMRDPYAYMPRMYLFQKANRLRVFGEHQGVGFNFQAAFGGEEGLKGASGSVSNASYSLLDASADVPLTSALRVRVGQFKVPYSRERLVDLADLQFADRSINTLGFNVGRDVGFAVHGSKGDMLGAFGVFTGGGIDVPIRNIPQKLGIPLLALRVGINKGLDKDIFGLTNVADFDSTDTRYAAYVNAIYTKNSKVGHSTALGAKMIDRSLLINSNWNSFMPASADAPTADWSQVGADFALQTSLGDKRLLVDAEVNGASWYSNLGVLNIAGGVVSGNLYYTPVVGIGLRYAVLFPDTKFAKSGTPLLKDATPIQEITPAVKFNLKNNVRLIFDLPIGIDVPVAEEVGNGTYNLMTQPDQTSYVTSGGITRETTLAGRLVFQFAF
ncbi:MAG: porin [Endomicrobiales bacterium]